MKFYSLQLKQKSTAGVSNGILQNFRTATFEKIFQVTYLLRHETIFLHRFSHCGAFQFGLCYLEPFNLDYVIHFINLRKGLVVEFFQVTYLLRHETIFLHRFSHCGAFQFGLCYLEPFNLDYVIHFINLRKGLVVEFLLSRFQWQKYLVSIRQAIKILPGNLPRVNECTTMLSINNVCDHVDLGNLIKPRIFQTFLLFYLQDYSFHIFFDNTRFLIKKNEIELLNVL